MENNQQSFYQFSDQLRVQTNNLVNLSLNDSIWSNTYVSKRPEERRNFDIRVGGELNSVNPSSNSKQINESDFNSIWSNSYASSKRPEEERRNFDIRVGGELISLNQSSNSKQNNESDFNNFNQGWKLGGSDFNGFNDGWKLGSSGLGSSQVGLNGGFNKGIYSKPSMNYNFNNNNNINNNNNVNVAVNSKKIGNGKGVDDHHHYGSKIGKKNKNNNNNNNNNSKDNSNSDSNKNSVDKRFKTLPPSESLPRSETVGGYIFVCNNDTMQENLKRQLFGLPPRYRDSVRAITPGLPLFLYNYSTHQLHGVFEAASFGGTNIDPMAWEDKKNPGESRFPAQVCVLTRKVCEPLEEDSFRPILHHYDGPKFRLELNIPEHSLCWMYLKRPMFKDNQHIAIEANRYTYKRNNSDDE
ncbi:unnamed protein product [Camellia sinensis]